MNRFFILVFVGFVFFLNIENTLSACSITIKLTKKTYCQNMGKAALDSCVLAPKTKFGTWASWRVLSAPKGVDTSKVVVYDYGWWLVFGSPKQDYFAGTYVLEYKVTDQISGCSALDTTEVEIVTEPTIKITPPNPLCVNWDTTDLSDYVLLNGARPTINKANYFTLTPFGTSKLINGKMFLPSSFGAGAWQVKFSTWETGCLNEDSFLLFVNSIPRVKLLSPLTLCEGTVQELNSIIDSRYTDLGSNYKAAWSGQWVTQNGNEYFFTANSLNQAGVEGPYKLKLNYTNTSTGCTDTEYYNISVRSQPKITVTTPKPIKGCENSPISLQCTGKYNNGVRWITTNGSDGTFDNENSNNVTYTPGAQDKAQHEALLMVSTLPMPGETCPQAKDLITIRIIQYPNIAMDLATSGCVPFKTSFRVFEHAGIADSLLTWSWDFDNGQKSTQQNPKDIEFNVQGKYNVKVTATNIDGYCVTSEMIPDYVQVYPKPKAAFTVSSSEASVYSPKFSMTNKSTLDQSIFSGSLNALWRFNDPVATPTDTSTAYNASWIYGSDTATYKIQLIVVSDQGCRDTAENTVHVIQEPPEPPIPNVFTPDGMGPGINNSFRPILLFAKDYHMYIFDRVGNLVFKTDNLWEAWDGNAGGKPGSAGVYYYQIIYTNAHDQKKNYKGPVLLLR